MNTKDNINRLFENLEGQFDINEPQSGHQQRFFEKLNSGTTQVAADTSGVRSLFRPWIGIAAAIALMVTLVFNQQTTDTSRDLASVSPEMAQTQDFFTMAIEAEMEKLEQEDALEYQDLIVDALFQIEQLEQNYNKLKQDLDVSGDDNRVIHAMISNFQNRIDILQQVLAQIEELKQLNTIDNENSSTL